MRRKGIMVGVGVTAALVLAGAGFVIGERIPYWRQEAECFAILERERPPVPARSDLAGRGEQMMDAGRRERAIQTLGEMKSVRAVPRLLALWDDMGGDLAFDQRQATRKALAAIGRPGLPWLKKALNDPETRGVAMQAIKDIEREEDRGTSLVDGVMR